jgi:RNase P/RNase MRP subunit p30
MIDVVLPHGNEKELIERAQVLGYKHLILAYSSYSQHAAMHQRSPRKNSNICTIYSLYLSTSQKEEILKQTKKVVQQNGLVFTSGRDNLFNRYVLDKTPVHALTDLEYVHPSDHTHYRRSGADQVLCSIAHNTKKIFITTLAALDHIAPHRRPLILGRIIQNIRLAQKYKVPYFFASFASTPSQMKGAHDVKSLLISLGMSSTHCSSSIHHLTSLCAPSSSAQKFK